VGFPSALLQMLTVELTTDPAHVGYAGTTDTDAAALLVAQNQVQGQIVSAQTVLDTLYGMGQLAGIVTQANGARTGSNTSAAAAVCQAMYDRLQNGQGFDCRNTAVATQVTADMTTLVTAGYLSQAAAEAVGTLAVKTTSRAEIIGLPQLVGYDTTSQVAWVNAARGGV